MIHTPSASERNPMKVKGNLTLWIVSSRPGGPPRMAVVKVLIVGCGRVGSRLASELDEEGHEVTIVDRDPGSFSRAAAREALSQDFKGNFLVGDGTEADLLRRAGIEEADSFVAVTEGDNRHIIAGPNAQQS